jgi:hypothetical protein
MWKKLSIYFSKLLIEELYSPVLTAAHSWRKVQRKWQLKYCLSTLLSTKPYFDLKTSNNIESFNALVRFAPRMTYSRSWKFTSLEGVSFSIARIHLEQCEERNGNALDSCFGGAWFESCLGHWSSWLRLVVLFLSPSMQMLGYYLD